MTEAASVGTQRPVDYQLLLPAGWFRISLEPEERERSIGALVDMRFKGVDNAPHLKEEMRKDLTKRARKIHRNGGVEFYLSSQPAGPLTIPASLVVTFVPPHPGRTLESLAEQLADTGPVGRRVDIVQLGSGDAVRARAVADPAGTDDGIDMPNVSAEYHLPVPHSDALLLLSFSSPLGVLADAVIELFEAIAGSLAWEYETES